MKTERLLFIHTSIWKVESTLTVEEARRIIEDAKTTNQLAKLPKPKNKASLWEGVLVDNEAVMFLDLNEVKVYAYEDNTFSAQE